METDHCFENSYPNYFCPDNIQENSKKYPDYCRTLTIKDANGTLKELVFPKALDLDRPKRARTTFSPEQLYHLEREFHRNQYLVGKERTELAKTLRLSETQHQRLPAEVLSTLPVCSALKGSTIADVTINNTTSIIHKIPITNLPSKCSFSFDIYKSGGSPYPHSTLIIPTWCYLHPKVKVWFQNRRTKYKRDRVRETEVRDSKAESFAACNILHMLQQHGSPSQNTASTPFLPAIYSHSYAGYSPT